MTLRGATPLEEGTGVFWQLRRLEPQTEEGPKRNAGVWIFTCLYFSDHHGPGQPSWLSGKEEELTDHEDTLMTKQPLSAHCGDRQDLAPWAL